MSSASAVGLAPASTRPAGRAAARTGPAKAVMARPAAPAPAAPRRTERRDTRPAPGSPASSGSWAGPLSGTGMADPFDDDGERCRFRAHGGLSRTATESIGPMTYSD